MKNELKIELPTTQINRLSLELEIDFYKKMIFVFAIMSFISLCGIISLAFPLQLLPNGTLQEVNYSINGTLVDIVLFNNSIYVVESNLTNYTNITNFYNITYQNITQNKNITYVNMTCLNCSNYYNETINNTYETYNYGYNKSDLDLTFLKINDYNSWKAGLNYATKDELTASINGINITAITPKEVSTTWLWISILGILLIEFFIIGYIIYLARGGE